MHPIVITTPKGASAEIYPYGAHLTSWKTAGGREWIFLSSQTAFEAGKAIRGGVPIIFPQFSERGAGPRHGFARTSYWELIDAPHHVDEHTQCAFRLTSNLRTENSWPHQFEAHYQIRLSDNALEMKFTVVNTDTRPFSFSAALHTYIAISSLDNVTLAGLGGKSYWNNDGSGFDDRKIQHAKNLTFCDALDRVYFDVKEALQLTDNKECLHLSQSGFGDVVVWNPGEEAVKGMSDMASDEYQTMLCVEAAAIDKPVTLLSGEQWVGVQRLRS